jgi:hypothetical protein
VWCSQSIADLVPRALRGSPHGQANPFRLSSKYPEEHACTIHTSSILLMKTNTRTFLTIPLAILLLMPFTAQCYYNASTGRWMSRDPIQEKGGADLYAFVNEDPVSRYDALGLFRDDWMTACKCTCVSLLSVSYPPGLTWYYSPDDLGRRFGVPVSVKWGVRGNPSRCHYYQDEKGSRISVWGINPKTDETTREGTDGNPFYSPEYLDPMGIGPFLPNQYTGTWGVKIHWVVTFRCVSEDGTKISSPGTGFDREGTFTVPPDGTMGNK